jgi:hypothetical protein
MFKSGASIVVVLATLTARSHAQCAQWDQRFYVDGPTVIASASYNGALYVGGNFTSFGPASAPNIAKWNGTSWSALGAPGSGTDAVVLALTVFDDGSGPALYAGGQFTVAGVVSASHVAKWDGTNWSPLGGGVGGNLSQVDALCVYDDGSGPALYAGGTFVVAGSVNASNIAKWNGTSWSPLGSGTDNEVAALGVFDDGSGPALYVGGAFTTAGGVPVLSVAKWNGTTWSSLGGPGSGVNGDILNFTVFNDGTGSALYVGGNFTAAGGISAPNIAEWNGTVWSAVGGSGGGVNQFVQALAVFDDGSGSALYAGGGFTAAGGASAPYIAKWNGTSWSSLSSGMNYSVFALAVFNDGSGPALYPGGWFDTAGGVHAPCIARWSGGSWSALGVPGSGLSGTVDALATFDDGSGSALYAGGGLGTGTGGTPLSHVAKWNGAVWSPLGSGVNSNVYSFTVFNDGSGPALYVGGTFTAAGGVSASSIAKWNGTSWSALGTGMGGGSGGPVVYAICVFDDGSGAALYVAGNFATAGGVSTPRIAKWNGSSWLSIGALGTGTFGIGAAMTVFDDGTGPALYAGGSFTTAGGVSAPNIAKWNGASWSALGAPGSGMNGPVSALSVFDDGTGPALYAGGSFTAAGGVSALNIAKWNGTSWSALGAPAGGADSFVSTLTAFNDGFGSALYAGGDFTVVNSIVAPHIAKWSGTSWSALGAPGTGMNNRVYALAVFNDGTDGDADLYAGGIFTAAGSTVSKGIAEWHGCGVASFCFGDGSAGACPCGNSGVPAHGCNNSASTGGALLAATGTTSPDTLTLTQTNELASVLSIFLQGDVRLGSAVFFGDGLRCIGGALKRLYVKTASSGTAVAPTAGDPSITARSAALGDPITAGSTRYYQVYYRDPNLAFCPNPPGDSFNVGTALRVVW